MRNLPLQYLIAFNSLIAIFNFSVNPVFAHERFYSDSTFKGWYFTPTGVYGRIALSKLSNRSYVKISRIKQDEVSVLNYNPAGIILSTTSVRFSKGKISLIITSNRWNEPNDSAWFTPGDANEFFVTEKLKGQNPNSPSQALRFIYKNDLLSEIYCMLDSNKTGNNQEGVAHYVFERYDDPKRFSLLKSVSFFGDIDNPVMSRKFDSHKIVTVYDENGNLIERSIYGMKDEPITDRFGSFKIKMRYDKNDNESETAYFDVNGVKWNEYFGCALRTHDYKNGFLEKETFYRSNYTITRPRRVADSVAITEQVCNKDGDVTEKTFFDEQYNPINNFYGVHRSVSGYNAAGMLTDQTFFDKKGSFAADEFRVHRYHYERNSIGQMISKSEFNLRDLPLVDPIYGAYKIKYRYDNWGRLISSSYWINDSLKMSNKIGCHEIAYQYDPAGMLTTVEYFDTAGKITSPVMGFSMEKLSYNEQEQVAERKYFKFGKPVMLKDTTYPLSFFSSIQYSYDFFNRVYSLEYFDDEGKPVNMRLKLWTGDEMRCHKVEFSYLGTQVISETLYDADNNPLGNVDCKSDNCIVTTGTGILMKKIIPLPVSAPKKYLLRGINIEDSLFFADQIAFLNEDSVVIFLNARESNLCEKDCATFYRLARVNKYYQFQGNVVDYYLENDMPAAQLKYENGAFNGPATYYYKNGQIKEKGEYRDNHRYGSWDYYYETGIKNKTIQFTENGMLLKDYFSENGNQLVRDGNGSFNGVVTIGNNNNSLSSYTMMGDIKNGVQDGSWKLFINQGANPTYVEKFSAGKFIRGTAYGLSYGEGTYKNAALSSFESIHPQEKMDYYGQNIFCTLKEKGINSSSNRNLVLAKDFYPEIHAGVSRILETNHFKDYTGWIFLYLHFDENGLLHNKYVRMSQENEVFKMELMKLLDGLSGQAPYIINNTSPKFNNFYILSKFYVILVENNQMVIPEELLTNYTVIQK